MGGVIRTIPRLQQIARIVRILPPPPAWIGTRPSHAKPQCFGDLCDSKNDSIWTARREMQAPHDAMHRVAWALQTAKGTCQKCEKPWENQGF